MSIVGSNTMLLTMANVGTPLMWVGAFHLAIGNLLLGIAEGILVAKLFRLPMVRSIGCLILANYFSAFIGLGVVNFLGTSISNLPIAEPIIRTLPRILIFSVVLLWLLTVVLEAPFFRLAGKWKEVGWGRAFRMSLAIQTVSYAVLFPIYLLVSEYSLYTHGKLREVGDFAKQTPGWVYYTTNPPTTLRRVSLADFHDEVVEGVIPTDRVGVLYPLKTKENDWNLYHNRWRYTGVRITTGTLVVSNFSRRCGTFKKPHLDEAKGDFSDLYGFAVETRSFESDSGERDFEIRTGSWAGQGLMVWWSDEKKTDYYALETPFRQFLARQATVLPTDQVVVSFADQILLFDPHTREFGLLAEGTNPVIGYE